MSFETELKKIGLQDKGAAVYLACLELGPSPVQQISRKAKVVRATTYVVLESLMQQGLVTRYKEGKKTLFSAEPPRQLMRLLEKQKEAIEDREHHLQELLPQLQVLMRGDGESPTVRYFAGREGLHAIRQEIVRYTESGDTIYNFTPADFLVGVFPDNEDTHLAQRVAKKIHAKTIFTTKSEKVKKRWLSEELSRYSARKYVSPEKFPSMGGLTIYRDRVAFGSYTGKLMGVIIESSVMANMMHSLFELAWAGAETIDSNENCP